MRYVILTHDWPFPHFDFMLEEGDGLRTWRLCEVPHLGNVLNAEPLPLHRREYLDYTGPVSGNRGSVARWDAGTAEIVSISAGEIRLNLMGMQLQGLLHLREVTGSSPKSDGN